MNILFIHEVDWLRKVVFEIHTLAEYLSLLGHKVYVIDYESMWVSKGPFDLLKPKETIDVARVYPEAPVHLIRPGFIKIPVLSRITAFVSHYFQIEKTIKEKHIEAIVLYSVPTNGLQTLYLAKKYRIPVIFRALDILNQMVRYRVLRWPTRLLETKVYSGADLILTLSPKLSDYVIKLGAPENKVGLLPLGVDIRQFHPSIDSSGLRKKWQIKEDESVIMFMGTLFDFSGLDSFLYHLPEIKKEVPGAKLLIVGDGPQRPKLENIIRELKLEKDVIITGFQPFSAMPVYINMAAIGINPFLITGATRDIFPGKIIQFLACGKVIVATPLPGMKAFLPQDECGVVFADNGKDIAREVVNLLKSPDSRQSLEEKAVVYVKQNHSYDIIAYRFESILEGVIKKKGIYSR